MNRVCKRLGIDHICHTRGIAGRGIRIAVLDSGVTAHPFLNGCLTEFEDFTKNEKMQGFYDDNGHGCHVCGILHRIAPASEILMGKVLMQDGTGDLGQALRGMEWVLEKHEEDPIHILNLSLGLNATLTKAKQKRLNEMMLKINDAGIAIICAAGNHCNENGRKHIRDMAGSALLVGCIASGPCYPDVVAPGEGIVSCDTGRGYVAKSGSSMATPVVSGVLALALEGKQKILPYEMYQSIKRSAKDLGYNRRKQGYGMIYQKGLLDALQERENK